MMLRVVAWPMGFIVLAKGAQQIFFMDRDRSDSGPRGPCLATRNKDRRRWLRDRIFWALCLAQLVDIRGRPTARGFRWSAENLKLGMMFLPLTGLVFCSFYLLPQWLAVTIGLAISSLTGLYSARTILTLVPLDSTPRVVRSWLPRLGIAAAETGPAVGR